MRILIPFVTLVCATVAVAHGQADLDQQVLDQLKKAGSNLKKPHSIDFYLYFPTKANAVRVGQSLKKDKFAVKVEPGANDSGWLCLATRKMVPTHQALAQLRRRFVAIATKYKGEYDGWETAVVK